MRLLLLILAACLVCTPALQAQQKMGPPGPDMVLITTSCKLAITNVHKAVPPISFLTFVCQDCSKTHGDIACSGTYKTGENKAETFLVFVSSKPPHTAEAIVFDTKTVYLTKSGKPKPEPKAKGSK